MLSVPKSSHLSLKLAFCLSVIVLLQKKNKMTFLKKLLLIFVLLTINQLAIGQSEEDSSKLIKKNSISGMINPLGFTNRMYRESEKFGIYASYERFISKNSSLSIRFSLSMDNEYYHIMRNWDMAYRYYFHPQKAFFQDFWLSLQLSNIKPLFYHSSPGHKYYDFELGFHFGKIFYFSKKKEWFVDMGIGIVANQYFSYNYVNCTKSKFDAQFYLKPIFLMGKKF
jgi:hypothetical protein